MDGMRRKRFVVRGRVQGVGFRDWTRRLAQGGGLAGWVRNRPDGTVEGVVAGPVPAAEAFLAALAGGPPSAKVESVEVEDWAEPVGRGFEVRSTG